LVNNGKVVFAKSHNASFSTKKQGKFEILGDPDARLLDEIVMSGLAMVE